jgi:hypothetical protein
MASLAVPRGLAANVCCEGVEIVSAGQTLEPPPPKMAAHPSTKRTSYHPPLWRKVASRFSEATVRCGLDLALRLPQTQALTSGREQPGLEG